MQPDAGGVVDTNTYVCDLSATDVTAGTIIFLASLRDAMTALAFGPGVSPNRPPGYHLASRWDAHALNNPEGWQMVAGASKTTGQTQVKYNPTPEGSQIQTRSFAI